MAIEFSERVRRIPVYPAASAYALPDDVAMLASNESPDPPLPQVVAAITRGARRPQPLPRPVERGAARRAERPLRRAAPARIAIGNGSCDILLAAGEALLEPGAELVYAWPSFSVYPHLAAASGATRDHRRRSTTSDRHDLDAMAAEITAATRLVIVCNPNNPTSTALPLDADRGVRRARAAPRRAHRRRGLLRVQPARRPRRDARPARARHPNLVLLRTFSKVYGLCGLRVGFALCGSEDFATAVNQVRQPFFCNARRAGRGDRGAASTRTRSPSASSARSSRASRSRTGCASSASSPPSRRRTSAGSTCPCPRARTPPRTRRRVVDGLAQRGVLVRAGTALGRAGALRVTYGTPAQNERFLTELGALLRR